VKRCPARAFKGMSGPPTSALFVFSCYTPRRDHRRGQGGRAHSFPTYGSLERRPAMRYVWSWSIARASLWLCCCRTVAADGRSSRQPISAGWSRPRLDSRILDHAYQRGHDRLFTGLYQHRCRQMSCLGRPQGHQASAFLATNRATSAVRMLALGHRLQLIRAGIACPRPSRQ